MREIKHLSVHQWLRSAISDSQQPSSPIGFLFLKLPPPPRAVLLVYRYPNVLRTPGTMSSQYLATVLCGTSKSYHETADIFKLRSIAISTVLGDNKLRTWQDAIKGI